MNPVSSRRGLIGILRSGEAESDRVEAFSDGVLAIVITLLVLEIHVPASIGGEDALWLALRNLLPMIGAWVVSFVFVLVFWVTHHYFFAQLTRVNHGVLYLNGLFLLCICFTPFPAALQAAYPGSHPATFLMALAMFLTACSFSLLRWYATFIARVTAPTISTATLGRMMRKSLIAPTLYLIGCLAAFSLVWLSLAIQALVPVLFFLPFGAEEQFSSNDH